MKDSSWSFQGWDGNEANASASATKSYHNGGVEGDSFSHWYDQKLADKFADGNDGNDAWGGTKGSGSGGTKGSGSGGTKGSGSGGTKGSGSGGTKGSGSGGTKGSGSDGTKGSDCHTSDDTDSGKTTLTYSMGTDPQVTVSVTETPSGTLFFDLKPTASNMEAVDINGLFLNLTDDSKLSSLMFSPEANQGSQYSQVTGTQADVNAVDTLADGSTAPGQFDAALQFGTQDDSTNGLVQSVNFTLWSNDGPLTFADIDLDGMTLLGESDSAGNLSLTVTGSDDDDCVYTGGTKGSGSGGTKGSGSGGTQGTSASTTNSYHNGGVEGGAFAEWYDENLADNFVGPNEDGTKGSGTGGTKGSGTGGSQNSGSSASGSGPELSDLLALMTKFPDDDDPSMKDQEDPWDEAEPDLLF